MRGSFSLPTGKLSLARDKDAAFTRYHELMSQPATVVATSPASPSERLVVVPIDEFLDWCEGHRFPDKANFKTLLVYDVSRWGRFQDADESAYYECICKRAGISVEYCAEQSANDILLEDSPILA
jgi:hypothetical protein